ncbi:MAG: sigma-54 dependent transcriptional regulator [Myxococcales bacterium]|nr:sigma-54 dependent transcriptional regulator [Myxococcales bacterium]
MAKVIIIDDNSTIREGASVVIRREGHDVWSADNGAEGVRLTKEHAVDMVFTDLKMDGLDGIGVLKAIREYDPEVAVVIITAFGTIDNAVDAIKLGAFDYVQKPFSPDTLRHKLLRGLEWRQSHHRRARLEGTQEVLSQTRDRSHHRNPSDAFEGMIGMSPPMQKLFGTLERIAQSGASVAISGESGTGKELVASALHNRSPRRHGPLIKVNCGAIPENLLESELFGHEKGAFTGAIKRKLGRFELADGGTIFLDEIGELPLGMQVKLLRVLQEKVVDRVGGERPTKIDVRVVSATNRKLWSEVEAGRFREDLFYRLQVVPIAIPPLRERTEDIVPLARHFLSNFRARTNPGVLRFSTETERRLSSYHFPGNVRELMNIVEQALVFANPPEITPNELPTPISGHLSTDTGTRHDPILKRGAMGLTEFLESVERREILAAYEEARGVKTETARQLGIKTSALYYKLEKYGIGTIASREQQTGSSAPQSSESQ